LRIGIQILHAIDFLAEAMRFIFGNHFDHAGSGNIHLIQRLNRRQTRNAALVCGLYSGTFPIFGRRHPIRLQVFP
jgi:hypothetical protein